LNSVTTTVRPNNAWLTQLRAICLALPEATEDNQSVGAPVFKVRGKIFAMQHPMNERPSLWCKAPQGFQAVLIGSDPSRFFVPPYVGHHGWIGAWLDLDLDWEYLGDLIRDSYRLTAPKRLVASLDAQTPT
jgi:predicted DNA-binding protein (MmcQ/YjbR family)